MSIGLLSCPHFSLFLKRKTKKTLVIGQKSFYQTSNELEQHFLNIERTQVCSSIGDWTLTPYFWLRTNRQWTSNLIEPPLDLLNHSSNRLEHRSSNIEPTHTCSSFGNLTFGLQMIEHRTWNIVRPITKSHSHQIIDRWMTLKRFNSS